MNELQNDIDELLIEYLELIKSPLYERIDFLGCDVSIFLSHN